MKLRLTKVSCYASSHFLSLFKLVWNPLRFCLLVNKAYYCTICFNNKAKASIPLYVWCLIESSFSFGLFLRIDLNEMQWNSPPVYFVWGILQHGYFPPLNPLLSAYPAGWKSSKHQHNGTAVMAACLIGADPQLFKYAFCFTTETFQAS